MLAQEWGRAPRSYEAIGKFLYHSQRIGGERCVRHQSTDVAFLHGEIFEKALPLG
jgi:hypothetical protein